MRKLDLCSSDTRPLVAIAGKGAAIRCQLCRSIDLFFSQPNAQSFAFPLKIPTRMFFSVNKVFIGRE